MLFLFVGFVSFALRLPSDGPSRFRPCLRLVLVSMYIPLTGFRYRGLSPHKFTPMPGVHNGIHRTAGAAGDAYVSIRKKGDLIWVYPTFRASCYLC